MDRLSPPPIRLVILSSGTVQCAGTTSESARVNREGAALRNEFTAIIEKDGDWFIAYCPEVPGANGQGRSEQECLKSLADTIELVLEDLSVPVWRGLSTGTDHRDEYLKFQRLTVLCEDTILPDVSER